MPRIVHKIYDTPKGFKHSVAAEGKEGPRVGFETIAQLGHYCATTEYWEGVLPPVFRIEIIEAGVHHQSTPHPEDV